MNDRAKMSGGAMERAVVRAALAFAVAASVTAPARAGPLELRQGQEVGAGTGFLRGDQCLVLTAWHVVREEGVEVTVLDRTGARSTGQVTYANPTYDVALVTLAPGHAVACRERWPDSGWMASASWTTRTEFEAMRHYPNGRESVILLRWAGGSADTLTLARIDRMEIRSSDSGSLVRQGERFAGIVKEVDTGSDRVEVVRFDVIDRLLGDRFRSAGAGAVTLDGVQYRGRPNANWTTYIGAWLTDTARRPLVPAGDPRSRCRIRPEVIDWTQRTAANPRYEQLQQTLQGCKTNLLFRNSKTLIQACESGARSQLQNTPRQVRIHAVQLKVDVQPAAGGATLSRLRSTEHTESVQAAGSRADAELQVLQASFAEISGELLGSGACD
ncbi:MAG: trypsin-like peptidase domain-containing protein [Rubrivivax sp.]|nr:trypsin-like peptidase domain-containing protein [Rubrivivax sp.]